MNTSRVLLLVLVLLVVLLATDAVTVRANRANRARDRNIFANLGQMPDEIIGQIAAIGGSDSAANMAATSTNLRRAVESERGKSEGMYNIALTGIYGDHIDRDGFLQVDFNENLLEHEDRIAFHTTKYQGSLQDAITVAQISARAMVEGMSNSLNQESEQFVDIQIREYDFEKTPGSTRKVTGRLVYRDHIFNTDLRLRLGDNEFGHIRNVVDHYIKTGRTGRFDEWDFEEEDMEII